MEYRTIHMSDYVSCRDLLEDEGWDVAHRKGDDVVLRRAA